MEFLRLTFILNYCCQKDRRPKCRVCEGKIVDKLVVTAQERLLLFVNALRRFLQAAGRDCRTDLCHTLRQEAI